MTLEQIEKLTEQEAKKALNEEYTKQRVFGEKLRSYRNNSYIALFMCLLLFLPCVGALVAFLYSNAMPMWLYTAAIFSGCLFLATVFAVLNAREIYLKYQKNFD